MRNFVFLLAAMCLSGKGCALDDEPHEGDFGENTHDSYEVCDPLESEVKPVGLRRVIAAGKDDSGTYYAIDHDGVDEEARVYISRDDTLLRAYVRGWGRGILGAADIYQYTVETQDARKFTLIAEVDHVTRMAVCPGHLEKQTFEELVNLGQQLETVNPKELADMPVENLPTSVGVEYLAQIANGDYVVVFRPNAEWTYDDFRLFVGPSNLLEEKAITDITRFKDGGTTEITYRTMRGPAVLRFPVHIGDEEGEAVWGAATFEIGDEILEVTRFEPTALSSYCFEYNCFY